jgi:MOSC domain-containing protein YiiM
MPCYKLNLKFERDDMIKRFLASRRSGFYFSVLEPGEVSAGARIEILERDPNQVAVADIVSLYLGQTREPELLTRAIRIKALPQNCKDHFLLRAQAASK